MGLRNVALARNSAVLTLTAIIIVLFNNCSGGFTAILNSSAEFPSLEQPTSSLPEKAVRVLTNSCLACHGTEVAYGNISKINDVQHLVATGLVVPGDVDGSSLYTAVLENRMPLGGTLSEESKAILRDWILQGAQKPASNNGDGEPGLLEIISKDSEVYNIVANDVSALKAAGRNVLNLRYFSLAHLNDGTKPESFFRHFRNGLTKVMNSTSWAPNVVEPLNVNSSVLIYRVDISELQWTAGQWQNIESRYPYRVTTEIFNTYSQRLRATMTRLRADLATTAPVIHMDWFIHEASQPDLYHRLLEMPTQVQALESRLGIAAQPRINGLNVIRMGMLDSDVSFYNRLIERFSTPYGGYWKSYDFSSEDGLQNILERPLGPEASDSAFPQGLRFHHAGGEIIFHLPNGMQAYLLINTAGERLDTAPTNIVQDPLRVDRTVTNAISCFMCHTQGLNKKYDSYQTQLMEQSQSYDSATRSAVQQLYPINQQMVDIFATDDSLFVESLRKMGITDLAVESIGVAFQLYEKTFDLNSTALFLGISSEALQNSIRSSEVLRGYLGALLIENGQVASTIIEQHYGEIYLLSR